MARILGIDIGTRAIRGVLVRSALRKVEEERYIEIPLAEGLESPGRLPELSDAVESLLRSLPEQPDSVVAAIPGEHVSQRTITLPAAVRKRLADVLPFELESTLPYDLEDAVIDHQLVGSDPQSLEILATAVLRSHVRETLEGLGKVGLSPRELAAGAAALDGLPNLLPELRRPEPVLVLDWSDERTDLCFLRDGRCVFARTLGVGLSQMPDGSDELKRGIGRTIAAFRAAGHDAPARIYACGSGAVADGALEWLGSVLDSEVTALPLPATPGLKSAGPAFGKAAALAARAVAGAQRINLRRGEFAPEDGGHGWTQYANLMVTCLVIIVMTVMFSLKARQALLVDERAALQSQLASATEEVFGESIENVALAQMRVDNPRSSDPLPRFDAFDALAALSGAVPMDLTHEVKRLTIDVADEKREGTMELQGTVASIAQRDQLVAELEKHPCFSDIERGKTSPGRDKDSIQYMIEAVIQCPGEGDDKESEE